MRRNRNKQQSQPPAPKAWSGQKPSTLRASSSTATPTINGTDKPLPKPPQQSQQKINGEGNNDKHAHDRAVFNLANCIVRLLRSDRTQWRPCGPLPYLFANNSPRDMMSHSH